MSESAKPAKPTRASAEQAAGDAERAVDKVAAVPRNVDGSPRLSDGFKVVLTEGASDEEKAAAWNLGGELPPEDAIEYVPKPHV